jgi:hypothetical protein
MLQAGQEADNSLEWQSVATWYWLWVQLSQKTEQNRLTDGGEVVSLMRRPRFTPQEDSWYSFLLEAD